MTAISDEARKKLKTIMSTKLIEMVGHCENELPDYVVSMIANNKTKEYMKKNLEVFIGSHSEAFSDWLMDLKSKMNPSAKVESSTPEHAEEDHVDIHVNEPEQVVVAEPKVTKKRELLVVPSKGTKKAPVQVNKASDEDSHSRKRKRIEYDVKTDDNRKSRSDHRNSRDERKRSTSRDRLSRKPTRREQSQERRRRERSKTWSDDEFGDPVPASKKLASSIAAVPRAPSPASKAVSSSVSVKRKISTDTDKTAKTRSNIFFRAMSDATQIKPKGTSSKVTNSSSGKRAASAMEVDESSNEAMPTVARPTADGATVKVRLDLGKAPLTNVDSQKAGTKRKIVWDLGKPDSTSSRDAASSSHSNVKGSSKNTEVSSTTASPERSKSLEDQENEAAIDAFIAATNLEMEMMKNNGDEDEEEIILSDSDEPAAKQVRSSGPEETDVPMETQPDKSKIKCSYWPSCKRGSECEYVHPTVACTKFPRCVFGKQCLYVHPPCRFGDGCRNVACPATHGDADTMDEVRKLLGVDIPLFQPQNMHLKRSDEPVVVTAASSKPANAEIPCRFRNMCKNPNCLYKHPAECRFGTNCLVPTCIFRHPAGKKPMAAAFPMANNKYKWKASA